MIKNKSIIFFVVFSFFSFLLFPPSTFAQTTGSSDAIAVRIIPNPNHYSISRWYDSQGFKGAPQALTVDGYEAIRDGRTVYVNASKVDINEGLIFTNIYLISYNQQPSAKTIDILGQIVKYWKFNDNIIESTNLAPSCSISSLSCLSDTDCTKDQFCATSTAAIASSSCQLKASKKCLVDPDCPSNFFCDSIKAKVIRDIKRVGKLEELKEALYRYKLEKGIYPRLPAGSYLADHAVSIWPSWLNTFLPQIAMTESFVDPINRLGACPGFDVQTCWNKDTQRFYSTSNPEYLALPYGSYGFVYKTDSNGSKYNLCAVMETRETTIGYMFSPNNPTSSICVLGTGIISGGIATNTAPRILSASFTGLADEEFNGSVKVIDDQGNPLTWDLDTANGNWSLWPGSPWSAAPILQGTSNPNQKKLYAVRAGGPGSYPITLTVSDGTTTGILSTSTSIVITNPKPFVEADNGEFTLDPSAVFSYSFYFSDNNLGSLSNTYELSKTGGPNNFSLPTNVTPVVAGLNRYKVTAATTIPTGSQFLTDTDYFYELKVRDKYSATTVKNFKITIKVTPPALTFNCPSNVRLGSFYSCFLGYTDQGNHQISYSSNNLPPGFTITIATTTNAYQNNDPKAAFSDKLQKLLHRLFALILPSSVSADSSSSPFRPAGTMDSVYLSGTSTDQFSQDVIITATNEYGTYTNKTFRLNINNYCGDRTKQEPNTEGRGGVYNDGYEDCDGISGITDIVASSNMNLQYGCSTKSTDTTPFPIYNNTYCVYKSPTDNGGFCGDGYCSASIKFEDGTEVNSFETGTSCPEDCDPNCSPVCGNKVCGSNNCGGSCGSCPVGQICNNLGACEVECAPQCAGKVCGPDRCGGVCQPNNCGAGNECIDGLCKPICIPECSGNTCGDDHCGGTCACSDPETICCGATCKPSPNFFACGSLCCKVEQHCCPDNGVLKCQNESCSGGGYNPLLCAGKDCGPDGQGGSCGTCPSPQICSSSGKCCSNNCQTCGGVTSSNWAFCGGKCCNQNTEICCGNTCRPKGSYILCGSTCCSPGNFCFGGKCLGK